MLSTDDGHKLEVLVEIGEKAVDVDDGWFGWCTPFADGSLDVTIDAILKGFLWTQLSIVEWIKGTTNERALNYNIYCNVQYIQCMSFYLLWHSL